MMMEQVKDDTTYYFNNTESSRNPSSGCIGAGAVFSIICIVCSGLLSDVGETDSDCIRRESIGIVAVRADPSVSGIC